MTTIAVKDNMICFDSRITRNGLIMQDDALKTRTVDGHIFFFSGYTCDEDTFVELYINGGDAPYQLGVEAYVYEEATGRLFACCVDDNMRLCKSPVSSDGPDALGSGAAHALTAMDMGASALEAVECAAKRDVYTGGIIRSFSLPVGDKIDG